MRKLAFYQVLNLHVHHADLVAYFTISPSHAIISIIVPSEVAATSWFTFSVSISYKGSPALNGWPECLYHFTIVAQQPLQRQMSHAQTRREAIQNNPSHMPD